jgi:hypothetical protein
MDLMATKDDLFEDMARALEAWTTAASEALTDAQSDLVWVENEKPYREIQHAPCRRWTGKRNSGDGPIGVLSGSRAFVPGCNGRRHGSCREGAPLRG